MSLRVHSSLLTALLIAALAGATGKVMNSFQANE
jgi:hypothetical protein